MKKIVNLLAVLLLIGCFLPMTARADVIYEPRDSFYEEHREECTYVGRNYTPNGVRTVTVYESPESDKVEAFYGSGDRIYISYTYEDSYGNLWGCCDDWDTEITGWVPMAYLEVIYDGISFTEEYGDRFVAEEGTIGKDYLGKTIYFWQYPGSTAHIDMELQSDPDGYLPEYSATYLDEDGNRWGKCSYYMGIKGYWINLDDASADFDTLFPGGVRETTSETGTSVTEPAEEIVPREPQSVKTAKLFAAVAVAAVVVVTGVLLILLKRNRK